ncbi:MAG: hypothetical protein E6K96_00070 [Thaumarchaeota archaeon]|nr:MAG: hypothetical protein E6K96_00070 [Nitrososphaerota archaeon]
MVGQVFGTAGVRGVFNKTQTPVQVYRFAETVAFVFGRGTYGVGWDGRKSSALLARTIAAAVNSTGSDALLFGLVPTPVTAFGARSRMCFVGFSVTASHNPPEFSGVKLFNGRGMELSQSDEERVERALAVEVKKNSAKFGSATRDAEIFYEYRGALLARYQPAGKRLRIAVDCAAGPGGLITPYVLKGLGHDVIPVNAQVSWRFPGRQPEPTVENLEEFARMVPNLGVDFGFAHDGDADRLVMVNRVGRVLPDSACSILALKGLGKTSGAAILSENTSTAVEEEAITMGLRVVRSKVGKTFASLEKEGGVFATEPSKVTDPAWGPWEDGMNAAALIATTISKDLRLLEGLTAPESWHYRQANLALMVELPGLVRRAREAFKRFRIKEERMLDGYKMVFGSGSWVMFRPSGTEPKTRVYCESRDVGEAELLIQEGVKCVESLVYNQHRPS